MYIELITERAKLLGNRDVEEINRHNFNTGRYWYSTGSKVYYCSSNGRDPIGDELENALRWFGNSLGLEPGVDWNIVDLHNDPNRFVPKKRTAIDGTVWWVPFDTLRKEYSSFLCHGRYKTMIDCQRDIDHFNNKFQFPNH